ncbi:MAG: Na+/H+ antiporter subunit D [Propionicimonas sp.]|uniref:Na+/H+ antiporter subunit D n=1 Tax=Propionicimonas sp. TaxID=1955623 RepID=UPI003D0F4678
MNNLLAVPVLVCLTGAGAAFLAGRHPTFQRIVSITAVAVVSIVAGLLVWLTDAATVVLWVGDWPQPLGIVLVADRLSALMLLVAALVSLAVLVYSTGQDTDELRRETPVSIFHPTFLLLVAGVSNAFLAGDLFNLFVSFELLLFASYVLLTMGGTRERIRAGSVYVVVNLVSSALFLVALASTYAATGTVNLAQLAVRLGELPLEVRGVLQVLLLTVFAIKAAIFPLSAWLPHSYPTAPAPVTAVFAGLLTKVGVYAIIRTQTLLFPTEPLSGLLGVAGVATMLLGILGAVAQVEIKRMLSFTLVSHIGYMVFGISLATAPALAGAIFYAAHHITIQATLFLVAGLIQRLGGSNSLDRLGGLARVSPLLGALFIIPAMNLAGIPPLSGFVAKLALLQAGVADGGPLAWALVISGVVTSLLTLYAMAKIWNRAFWGVAPPSVLAQVESFDSPELGRPLPRLMVGSTMGLVALALAFTVAAGPMYDYVERSASALFDRSYIAAVLGGGSR